jgi:hypothetical protein
MLETSRLRDGLLAGLANAIAFLTALYFGAIWAVRSLQRLEKKARVSPG